MGNIFLVIASISGFIAVALGAFVAHVLEPHFTLKQLTWFEKAWRYQVFHTLAILALGLYQAAIVSQAQPKCRQTAVNIIGGCWGLGILCFSGGLYSMLLWQTTSFAMIVPIGGVAFLMGWAALIYITIRNTIGRK